MDITTGFVFFLVSVVSALATQVIDVHLSPPLLDRNQVCYGTNNGLSFSGNSDLRYQRMRRRYSGCTHVEGNLEITHLYGEPDTYDLSFLSSIRVVTGYVLIGDVNARTISMPNLVLIRADNTIQISKNYGLAVVVNDHLLSLQMPALKEISNGDVLFAINRALCFVDSIAWDIITAGNVSHRDGPSFEQCPECAAECADETGERHCWGPGPGNCQEVERTECDWICPGRCHSESIIGCCHPECAGGCTGSMPTECTICRNYRHRGRCVSACPARSYATGQECEDY